MAKFYPELTESLQQFIAQQHLFFTATAPTEGRINLSPKGIDTFRILNPQAVAYLDLTGSGNESSAHLIENGRMTIMFCSFQGAPLILRLYGRGQVIYPRDVAWQELASLFPPIPGTRQIIKLAVELVQTSCGAGVPLYDFVTDRDTIIDWAIRKGKDGLQDYWHAKNQVSIDGLPTHLLDES
ncbi:MAG: pyridoxamine 5'-phosphate oxidase family protein [Myxacorys californica WJT36-NPBG1]|jgi:hypothetical protein|nr:pyridoxamine 5'-phosphate oxidase family protein [Myxacorys californica WJT36-NPBG1]